MFTGYQTNQRAYSGPVSVAHPIVLASHDVDIFGLDWFDLAETSQLSPDYPIQRQYWQAEVLSTNPHFTPLDTEDFPAGLYKIRYLSGAIKHSLDQTYNKLHYTEFCFGDWDKPASHTIWLKLNEDNNRMFYIDTPAFTPEGYASAQAAALAATGYGFAFYHPGGPIEAAFDDWSYWYPRNTGSVVLQLQEHKLDDPEPGPGSWQIVFSSIPEHTSWPYVEESSSRFAHPRIRNLLPGVHVLRYSLDTPRDDGPWYQDFYLRVWGMPPRCSPMAYVDASLQDIPTAYRAMMNESYARFMGAQPSLFPVKPVKPHPLNPPGTPIHQKPKYSGNEPERRESPNQYSRPKQLGSAEKF